MSEICFIKRKDAVVKEGYVSDCLGDSWLGLKIKVEVCRDFEDKIAIIFLTPNSFHRIGDFEWYFKDEFFNAFEFFEE